MPLILGAQSATAVAQDNSCRFNRPDNPRLYRTPGSDGNRKTFTVSCWVKRSGLSSYQPIWETSGYCWADFKSDDSLRVGCGNGVGNRTTDRLFRDVGAWMHLVFKFDTTQGAAADRLRIYINGVEETSFSASVVVVQDFDTDMNWTGAAMDVLNDGDGTRCLDGYAAEFVILDGTAALPTSFGEFDSDSPTIWKPIDVSGLTFGTNGLYMDFEDSSNLGNDVSGNGNDLTVANLVVADQSQDSPVNNFATMNPLVYGTSHTYTDGNTTVTNSGATWEQTISTLGTSAGKFYWETKWISGAWTVVGVDNITVSSTTIGYTSTSVGYKSNGDIAVGAVAQTGINSYATGDIISVALDMDNDAVYFAKNGTWENSGVPTSGASKTGAYTLPVADSTYFPTIAHYDADASNVNFGNGCFGDTVVTSSEADENGYGLFEYAPPSGYLALCTKNLGSDGG